CSRNCSAPANASPHRGQMYLATTTPFGYRNSSETPRFEEPDLEEFVQATACPALHQVQAGADQGYPPRSRRALPHSVSHLDHPVPFFGPLRPTLPDERL